MAYSFRAERQHVSDQKVEGNPFDTPGAEGRVGMPGHRHSGADISALFPRC